MLTSRYQNLNYYNSIKNNVFCKSYVLADEGYPLFGKLFLILNIGNNTQKGLKIADILQEIIKYEYFKGNPTQELEAIKNFESTVNKINQAFVTLIENNHFEWINQLNFALVSVFGKQIQFVSVGNIKMFLLRGKTLISLVKKSPDSSPLKPTKIFSNIISGTVQEKDKLIISTAELFNYFSEENIKQIIDNFSPKDACFQLQNILSQKPNITSAAASIFLEIDSNSQKELVEKEKIISELSKPLDDKLEFEDDKQEKNDNDFWGNKIKYYSSKIYNFSSNTIQNTISKFKKIKNSKFKKDPTLEKINKKNNIVNNWQRGHAFSTEKLSSKTAGLFQYLIKKYQNLPKTSKMLFIVSSVFAIAFVTSITLQINKKNNNKNDGVVEQQLKNAVEKEKMAADALIYSDFNKAKGFLSEAKNILENKEIEKSEQTKKEKEDLLNKINAQYDKIDKIIRIENPTLAIDIPSEIKAENILGINENVYTYNPLTNIIYQIEESAKKLGTISQESTNIGYFRKGTANSAKNSLIFLTDTPSLVEFDLTKKTLSELDIIFSKKDSEIADLKSYNDRLYLLDTKNNQIFKHARTISGYSKGVAWIKEANVDLAKTKSFALDGAAYILNENGSIIKLLNGYLKTLSLIQPSKEVTSPTKIFTLLDYKFLYLLDPSNNRFLVFDKEKGELKNQYLSNNFTEMKDIYVDEKNKKAFLLCGQKIYGVVLEGIE